jgi:sulfate-transporting ATPase
VQALNTVSLQVAPGEVVGLVGPNGAGKTTLIDTVSGFTRAASGQILLDGRDITGWAPTRISRAGIARSFQSVQLFEAMTVRDNLLVATDASSVRCYASDLVVPRRARPNELMEEVLAQFRLDSVLDALPSELPHGIARLAGVARALLSDPRILLLDEPAAGLGSAESAELGPMIREMAATRGISVLLVEHDVPLVLSTCDRVVVLDFGKRIAVGVPEEIRRDEAVVAAYLGTEVPDGSR